jgi:dolichol-phosphate mannosyltransferase
MNHLQSPNSDVDISIIIPCYNEGDNISALEQKLFPVVAELSQHQNVEVIVIDDGSCDDTAERLQKVVERHPELRVVSHARNQGIGAALCTGFTAARGAWIVTTDADGTYRFDEVPKLLALCGPEVDIVTASPYHPLGGVENVPAYRLVLSRGASLLYRMIVGGHIHTYTALFRAYRQQVLDTVPVRSAGFLAVAQLLAEASLQGYRIAEYPTVLHVRQYGQSKAKVMRLMLQHLQFMAGLLLQCITRTTHTVRYPRESL